MAFLIITEMIVVALELQTSQLLSNIHQHVND